MSLFRLNEWYSTHIEDASAMAVGSLWDDRDQLIVGSEHGLVTVLDPGGTEKTEDIMILQQAIDRPVIQIMTGDFLTMPGETIAVLTPAELILYRYKYDPEDATKNSLQPACFHKLPEAAFTMCSISQPSSSCSQILVEGVGCGLTLFQGDQVMFSRAPLPSLLPGPIGYNTSSQSVVLASGGQLHSVKFSLLASMGNSGKKITFDWTFNLGDHGLSIAMDEGHSVQPSIIVLCRRNVFCLNTGGFVRWQIRLEAVATSMHVYRLTSEFAATRLLVATSSNTLLVYSDNRLLWTCQTDYPTVSICIGSFNAIYHNVLSLLSVNGHATVGVIGTNPTMYPVAKDNRHIDYKVRQEEMKSIETELREITAAGGEPASSSAMSMTCKVIEIGKGSMSARSEVPACVVQVEVNESVGSQIQFNVYSSLSYNILKSTPNGCSIEFFLGSSLPSSCSAHIVAYSLDTHAICGMDVRLPLQLIFVDCTPDRNAKVKLVLDSDRTVIPLNELFTEFTTENPSSLAFQVFGSDARISIFSASKSNRYRIQTDHAVMLYIIVNEMVTRLQKQQPGVMLHAQLPIQYVIPKVEEFIEMETECGSTTTSIGQRAREVREIQALLMRKYEQNIPENVEHIDCLLDDANEKLIRSIDGVKSTQKVMRNLEAEIGSLFDLLSLLMKLDKHEPTINSKFYNFTQQSLRERLVWASGAPADPARMLAVLCRHTEKALPLITEEEGAGPNEEEEEFVQHLNRPMGQKRQSIVKANSQDLSEFKELTVAEDSEDMITF